METDEALRHVLDPDWEGYTPRERLAIEFAERFSERHHALDDGFFAELAEHFSDEEIVELAVVAARHMAIPRISHVLGLDEG